MMFPAVFLSMIVLLVICLPSLDGKQSSTNHNNQRAIPFRGVLFIAKGQFFFKVKGSQGKKEDHLQTSVQESVKMKHEQQATLQKTKTVKLKNLLEKKNIETHQLLSEAKLKDKMVIGYNFSTNKGGRKKIQLVEQLHMNILRRHPKTFQSRLEMNINQQSNPETNVPLLWKRGQEKSTETQELETDRTKLKDHHPNSNAPSKLKVIFHPIADAFSKAKHIIKPPNLITGPLSKTKKSASKGTRRSNSIKSGSSKGLTSGLTKKPSGLGQVPTEYPAENFPVSHYEASPPRKKTPTMERRWSGTVSETTPDANQAESRDGSPPPSPMKSPEVRQIWNFIDRVSKTWKETEDNPIVFEEFLPPKPTQTTDVSGPQLPERTIADANQGIMSNESPSTRRSSLRTESSPPNIKPPDAELSELTSPEDKEAAYYIDRCKKGWATPANLSAAHEETQSRSSSPSSSRKPRSATRSPSQSPIRTAPRSLSPKSHTPWSPDTQSPSARPPSSRDSQSPTRASPPRSPVKSPPQSPIRNSSQSPTRPRSPIQPQNLPQAPMLTLLNSIHQLRQLSNKQINDQYNVLSNKLRSGNQLGQKAED